MLHLRNLIEVPVKLDRDSLSNVVSSFIQKGIVLHRMNASSTILPSVDSAYEGIFRDLLFAMEGGVSLYTSVPEVYADLRNAVMPKTVKATPAFAETSQTIDYSYKFTNLAYQLTDTNFGTISDNTQLGMFEVNPPVVDNIQSATTNFFQLFAYDLPLVDPRYYDYLKDDASAYAFEKDDKMYHEVPIRSRWLANLCLSRNASNREERFMQIFYGPPSLALFHRFETKMTGDLGANDYAIKTNISLQQLILLALSLVKAIRMSYGFSSPEKDPLVPFGVLNTFYFHMLMQHIIMTTFFEWSPAFVYGEGIRWGSQFFPLSTTERASILVFESLSELLRRYFPVTNVVSDGTCKVYVELVNSQDPRFGQLYTPEGWEKFTPFDFNWLDMTYNGVPLLLGVGTFGSDYDNWTLAYRANQVAAQPIANFNTFFPFRERNQCLLSSVFNLYYDDERNFSYNQFFFSEFASDQQIRLAGIVPYVLAQSTYQPDKIAKFVSRYSPKAYSGSLAFLSQQNLEKYAMFSTVSRGSKRNNTTLVRADEDNAEKGNGAIGIAAIITALSVTAVVIGVISATAGLIAQSVSLSYEIKQLNQFELHSLARQQIDMLVLFGKNFDALYGQQIVHFVQPLYNRAGQNAVDSYKNYSREFNEVMSWITDLFKGKDYVPVLPMHYMTMLIQLTYTIDKLPGPIAQDIHTRITTIPGYSKDSGFFAMRSMTGEEIYVNANKSVKSSGITGKQIKIKGQ